MVQCGFDCPFKLSSLFIFTVKKNIHHSHPKVKQTNKEIQLLKQLAALRWPLLFALLLCQHDDGTTGIPDVALNHKIGVIPPVSCSTSITFSHHRERR